MIKPLDIVRTPKGGLAIVTECSFADDNWQINRYSINYIENPKNEHNAWWMEGDLTYLASIPIFIAEAMCHPFGNNKKDVKEIMK